MLFVSRAVRNRFTARGRKKIGDLCLLVDQPNDAIVHYEGCMELLKATGDEFWVGGLFVYFHTTLYYNYAVGQRNYCKKSDIPIYRCV